MMITHPLLQCFNSQIHYFTCGPPTPCAAADAASVSASYKECDLAKCEDIDNVTNVMYCM